MNKIISFLILAIFVSCSSSDSEGSGDVKIKKAITTTPNEIRTTSYFYNGDKLDYILLEDGDRIDYTYSGDLISQIEFETPSGDVLSTTDYFYDTQQRLVEQVGVNHAFFQGFRTDYQYNSDGTVTAESFSGDDQIQDDYINTLEIEFAESGEIATTTVTGGQNPTQTTYTYDSQKNPFMNITGIDKLFLFSGFQHNVLSETRMQNGDVITQREYDYNYNQQGFPASATMLLDGQTYQVEYQYQ